MTEQKKIRVSEKATKNKNNNLDKKKYYVFRSLI